MQQVEQHTRKAKWPQGGTAATLFVLEPPELCVRTAEDEERGEELLPCPELIQIFGLAKAL